MEIEAARILAVLGHPQRLALFRLLMRRYPEKVPAGELAGALDVRASTLSAYLATLAQAGLIEQERSGTSLRYCIVMPEVRRILDFLFFDCCRGRPEICAPLLDPLRSGASRTADRMFNVLFVCTGNSARSLFAEAILRSEGLGRFNACSAGTHPTSRPNPHALEVLKQRGHDVAELRSKSVLEFRAPDATVFDFVFTVCDQAANEDCPAWAGQPISAHWGIPDPDRAGGGEAERSLAFHHAYDALKARIGAFTALPFHTLDRLSLQGAVDDIGRTPHGVSA